MDKRLLSSPDFLMNNLDYVKQQATKEGMELVMITSEVPGIGITYEVIEDGV
jgi:hypothetical protein